jgi:3-phenylpropionate/cinnamic acid dioxygenase small subunit
MIPDACIGAELEKVKAFLSLEADLLDERRFEDWLDLFTEDAHYWVPSRAGQNNHLEEVSIFSDDRELMELRVRRLQHPSIHVQTPPSRTVRYLTNVSAHEDAGALEVTSRMLVLEYRQGEQRLVGGRCKHRLIRKGDSYKITQKRVDIVGCEGAHLPIAVPF